MRRTILSILAAAISGAALAQGAIGIYVPGRTISDQGIAVKSWGSGTIAETDEVALEGTNSIRVSTRNFFQGGRVLLSKPVDLAKAFSDKNSLLLLTIKVADSKLTLGGGGGPAGGGAGVAGLGGASSGGAAGGPPAGRGGGLAGGPPSGGGRGGGLAGGDSGGGAAGSGLTATAAPLRNLRFVITTTDGLKSEGFVPTGGAADKGWRRVGIPLQAITGFDRTNKQVQEIAFSGDATGTFYIGEMNIVTDSTPITGEPNIREMNLALGDEVELWANGMGGASVLKYTWDFDSADGVQVDAEGQVIKRKFRKPGEYVVTLTISDSFGLKQPYSTTIKVTVNP